MSATMISTASTAVFDSETVLGKRKSLRSFILHLVSDSTSQPPSKNSPPPIIVNGSLVPHTNKRYKCTYNNCEKSYSKSSRLAEHERSHTGQVVCMAIIPSLVVHKRPSVLSSAIPATNHIFGKPISKHTHVVIFQSLLSRWFAQRQTVRNGSGPHNIFVYMKSGTMA
jgi:hypothetical protein